jgi:hypothetical protein
LKKFSFFNEIHDFQKFIRENIEIIGNYTIVSEQLKLSNNETGIIDILAINNSNKRLTVIELKNETTTDKNIWQPLRYYDMIKRGEDSVKELLYKNKSIIKFDIEEIDMIPKILFVVPHYNEQLLRSLSYFDNVDIEVIVVERFKNGNMIETNKQVYFPSSIYHKDDLVNVKIDKKSSYSFEEYELSGINKEKINLAKKYLNKLETIFLNNGYKFDFFFMKTKITIMKNEKVWGHIFIKQQPLSDKLTLSFNCEEEKKLNKYDFLYEPYIEDVSINKKSITIKVNNLIQNKLIEKCISC